MQAAVKYDVMFVVIATTAALHLFLVALVAQSTGCIWRLFADAASMARIQETLCHCADASGCTCNNAWHGVRLLCLVRHQ